MNLSAKAAASRRPERKSKGPLLWQLPLTVAFLCFGLLLMAQYNTHIVQSSSLANESHENLALIIKNVNDNLQSLTAERRQLEAELNELTRAVQNGDSLTSAASARINNLKTAIGWQEVNGPGLSMTITSDSNLMYRDIIDIVNELMNSGAEAVSINEVRFTVHTQIAETIRSKEVEDAESGEIQRLDYSVITIDGQELRAPIIIRAIGNPATLESALTLPGGIMSTLVTLFGVEPTIRQAENLVIPAAIIPEFNRAQPPAPPQ